MKDKTATRANATACVGSLVLLVLCSVSGPANAADATAQPSPYGTLVGTAAPAPASPAPPPEHVFGDWGGLRTRLSQIGINYTLDYTTESVANVSGGIKNGVAYAHQIGLSVDVDWQTLAGIPGFTTHTSLINRAGNNASAHYVGDTVIQAQEIYGAGFGQVVKLVWFYGEEKLLDDRLKLSFGRFAPGTDYAASPLYCDFMTLTICGHPRALTANQGFEDWPMNEWGGEVTGKPTGDTYVRVGVFQSQPFPTSAEPYTQGGHSGWDWTLDGTTGVSIPVEVGYDAKLGAAQLPGHYKLGFDWDTSDYQDNFADVNGMPLALTGLAGKNHDGRGQFWATADQLVWQHGANSEDGIYLLGAYARDDPSTSLFQNLYWAGLIDRGFWRERPDDRIGFGVTYYDVGKGLTRTEELQNSLGLPLAGGARGIQTNGMVYELNYNFKAYSGIQIQPELEYFVRPGATSAVRNAFLVGLKTYANF